MHKAVLKNFAIFTGKHLCWSFCLIKLQLQTGWVLGGWVWNIASFSRKLWENSICE